MNLHENKELFADAVLAASQSKEDGGLGIIIFLQRIKLVLRNRQDGRIERLRIHHS